MGSCVSFDSLATWRRSRGNGYRPVQQRHLSDPPRQKRPLLHRSVVCELHRGGAGRGSNADAKHPRAVRAIGAGAHGRVAPSPLAPSSSSSSSSRRAVVVVIGLVIGRLSAGEVDLELPPLERHPMVRVDCGGGRLGRFEAEKRKTSRASHLCCVVLCCVVLCCVVLCCVALCCVALCCVGFGCVE